MRNHKLLLILLAVLAIAGCRHGKQETKTQDIQDATETMADSYADSSDKSADTVAVVARGDKKIVLSRGGRLDISLEGVHLRAAEGTLLHDGEYSVTALSEEELPPMGGMMENVTGGSGRGYRLLPGGEHFAPYAELRVKYDKAKIPVGYSPEDIFTSYYDISTHKWTRLYRQEVDTVNCEIVSLTSHFTDFVNEILKAPEMPETHAYVPTTLSDIKAGEPLGGLTLMQPPSANNMGTANMSLPIDIPAGRHGMQPSLALTYSNSRGNGWLGIGWDIEIPAITVDTRWGVPRYSSDNESEIYLKDGEQMTTRDGQGQWRALPHRTNQPQPRLSGNIQFFPLVDESADSVVRHGDTPLNYWWSVTHRNGVTDYYGSRNGQVDYQSVLRNDDGKIAYWPLTESEDTYGNKVRYYYDIVTSSDQQPGKQIYVSRINYTGFGNQEGRFNIIFDRNCNERIDKIVSGRYGFKEVTAATLVRIRIEYWTDTTHERKRAYYFITENSRASQYKTRLTDVVNEATDSVLIRDSCEYHITPLLNSGKGHATHYHCDYYDYPTADSLFGPTRTFSGFADDHVTSDFSVGGALAGSTLLGTSKGKSWSVGGTATVGAGPVVCLTSASLGGNFSYGQSSSEGLITMIDLDGDGLADKVYKQGNHVYYRPRRDHGDTITFGESVMVKGLEGFLSESSSTTSGGVQLAVGVSLSGSWSTTNSTTTRYFADINGDGLPDLVQEGGVLFNHINSDGFPEFSSILQLSGHRSDNDPIQTSSECGGIIYDGEVDPTIVCTKGGTICPPTPNHADYEAVQVWVAPTTGTIDLYDTIQLIEDTSISRRQSRYADGVGYIVERHNGITIATNGIQDSSRSILYSDGINANDYSIKDQHQYLSVTAGNILMFRLRGKEDGSFDNVRWHHKIVYRQGNQTYDSEKDFILTGNTFFQAAKNGTIRIIDTLSFVGSPIPSMWYKIHKNNTVYDSLQMNNGSNSVVHINEQISVNSGDSVYISITSCGNNNTIDWSGLRYHPRLTFVRNYSEGGSDTVHWDTIRYDPVVRMDVNPVPLGATVSPLRKNLCRLFGPLYKGWGQFAYRNEHQLVDYNAITLTDLKYPRLIYPEYNSEVDTTQLELNIDTNISLAVLADSIDSIYNPLASSDTSRWVEMSPNGEYESWVAFGNTTRVSRYRMTTSRPYRTVPVTSDEGEGMRDPSSSEEYIPEYTHAVPVSLDGSRVTTIRKQSKSKSENFGVGIDLSVASLSHTRANSTTDIKTDFMDINGDRYPDLIGGSRVQYTNPWGGIGSIQNINGVDDTTSSVSSTYSGARENTFGAGYPVFSKQLSSNPKLAKTTVDGQGSVGANLGNGKDSTRHVMMDINGDGLPDIVENGQVRLNVGYKFLPLESWGISSNIRDGDSRNRGASLGGGFSLSHYSISGGVSVNYSDNSTNYMLTDVNGDGLPDKVTKLGNSLQVQYSYGNGSYSLPETLSGIGHLSHSRSFSESVNASLTVGFTFFGILKVCGGIQGAPYNRTFTRDSAQLVDINGDGYPDYVTSNSETNLSVRYNRAGKTNLLKRVTNFSGSRIDLGYELTEASYEKPQRSWVLSEVSTYDESTPLAANRTYTTYSYRNPHYDRYDRIEYGFDTVITCQHTLTGGQFTPYRYVVEGYDNRNFNKRGKKVSDMIEDASHSPFIETLYNASVRHRVSNSNMDEEECPADVYVSQEVELRRYYEGNARPGVVTMTHKTYDRYHNIVEYIDYGDTSRSDEYYAVDVTYAHGRPNNLVSLPKHVIVKNKNNSVLRERTAEYNNNGSITIHTLIDGSESIVSGYNYDQYGNIDSVTLPPNNAGQQMTYKYTYDNKVFSYPVGVTNALGYHSESEYDVVFGQPTLTRDVNGNVIRYQYDPMGRLTRVIVPHEHNAQGWTIEMKYNARNYDCNLLTTHPQGNSSCITLHYDRQNPTAPIITSVLSDGWGRPLQSKMNGEVDGNDKVLVLGTVDYDCFGRTVRQGLPDTSHLSTSVDHFTNYDNLMSGVTLTEYDILDRKTYIRQPYNYETFLNYSFDTVNGSSYFLTTTIDANNHPSSSVTGSRGQQIESRLPLSTITRFEYSPLGEITRSIDPEGNITTYRYDHFGRLARRTHPDAGNDIYIYDKAGNVTKHITQKLNNANQEVEYVYRYNQLTDIRYPENPRNNVRYRYGGPTDTLYNQVGRLVWQEDATGWQSYRYGKLGELTWNERTMIVPHNRHCYTFLMQYNYDVWNRIQSIVYPDGETVSYHYSVGGKLNSIGTRKGSDTTEYIRNIDYNERGLKLRMVYRNGVSTRYTYDSILRLSNMTDGTMQDITYTYDKVGNILRIDNTGNVVNSLGGGYVNEYRYDSLYRLVRADGAFDTLNHHLRMTYSPAGRILSKSLTARLMDENTGVPTNVNYAYGYTYNNAKPHTVREVRDRYSNDMHLLEWDANGNLQYYYFKSPEMERWHCWDEDNRLQATSDNHYTAFYQYGADGNRALKLSGESQQMSNNGNYHYFAQLNQVTLYPSPHIVVDDHGYTKHYYADNERICSRIGGGGIEGLYLPTDSVTAEMLKDKPGISARQAAQAGQCAMASVSVPSNTLGIMADMQTVQSAENDIYFVHSDHLGSASWVTNLSGQPIQHLQYLPYGESYIDQRSSTFHERYTFTGKEKDSESGYYYFGARYFMPNLSIWNSVDPMADKYPSLSPYNYCAWNPMVFVDPEGMECDDYFSKTGKYLGSDGASTRNVRIIDEKLWNSLDKDENGHVEHDLANSISASFSQASSQSMTESEQLSVYQHYNPTDCNIENFGGDGKAYGMRIHFEYQKKPIIRIRLKGNSTGFKVCDYADEIANLFSHEKGHLDLYESIGHKEYQSLGESAQERIAVQAQMNDPSWGGTREKFKQDFISYGRKYGLK